MRIRAAMPGDAAPMAALLNRIIRIGGTTAHQQDMSPKTVLTHYITGPATICCHVAEDAEGQLLGFQSLAWEPLRGPLWAGIGTFVSPDLQARGTGAALFQATLPAARAAGAEVIDATIRADNRPGLAYYARIGFVDYATDPDWALADGQVVGRVQRRFDL